MVNTGKHHTRDMKLENAVEVQENWITPRRRKIIFRQRGIFSRRHMVWLYVEIYKTLINCHFCYVCFVISKVGFKKI